MKAYYSNIETWYSFPAITEIIITVNIRSGLRVQSILQLNGRALFSVYVWVYMGDGILNNRLTITWKHKFAKHWQMNIINTSTVAHCRHRVHSCHFHSLSLWKTIALLSAFSWRKISISVVWKVEHIAQKIIVLHLSCIVYKIMRDELLGKCAIWKRLEHDVSWISAEKCYFRLIFLYARL